MSMNATRADELGEAIHWMIRLREAPPSADALAAYEQWRTSSPERDAACARVTRALARLEPLQRRGVRAQQAHRVMQRSSRRSALRATLGLAGMGVGAGVLSWQVSEHAGWWADESTTLAQRMQVSLPQQASLWLDARTQVDTESTAGEQVVTLRRGQVLVDATASALPVVLRGQHGTALAQRGRFVAKDRGALGLRVTALEGPLLVTPRESPAVQLQPGTRALLSRGQAPQLDRARGTEDLWTRGLIALHDEPLSELVDALRAYRGGVIRLDPQAARLRISGVFSLDDTDRTLRALDETRPLRVSIVARYWVSIAPA